MKGWKKWLAFLMCLLILSGSTAALADGWRQSGGRWWYARGESDYAKSEWLKDGGKWYYFDGEGWMVTGWLDLGSWYYFSSNGSMVTGWQNINGKWYYFRPSGEMAEGWLKSGTIWFYLVPGSGNMVTGWQEIDGAWYYFNRAGTMHTGFINSGNTWYYCSESGAMVVSDWVKAYGYWYYFDENGAMVTGSKEIDGVIYYFDANGRWIERLMGDDITVNSFSYRDSGYGPDMFIQFKNNLNVAVDRLDFTVYFYDAFGNPVYSYGGTHTDNVYNSSVIAAGGLSKLGDSWSGYGYYGAKQFGITVYQYHIVNGTTVEIPANQQVTHYFN